MGKEILGMDPTTVRLIAGVLAVLLVIVLFMRRRSRKAD
jgi:phage shock protein PspC (stress-responsive transcriptional regulator)